MTRRTPYQAECPFTLTVDALYMISVSFFDDAAVLAFRLHLDGCLGTHCVQYFCSCHEGFICFRNGGYFAVSWIYLVCTCCPITSGVGVKHFKQTLMHWLAPSVESIYSVWLPYNPIVWRKVH